MMKVTNKLFLLIGIFVWTGYCSAQVSFDGCIDFRGQSVASILDYSINDVAIARIERGQAVIRYNPNVLAQMSEATRQFFYVHECAHHALQHTVQRPSLSSERQADCWAIRTMKDNMGLSLNSLRAIQNDITRQGRGDWTHLPGPYRSVDIENCLDQVTDSQERIPCQHRMACSHTQHPFDTMHQFDQYQNGNRYQCAHRMQCSHTAHQFDTEHQFDYR